jgi:MYXO-CTERM domain-containing protein
MDFDVERTRVGTDSSPAWASWSNDKAVLRIADTVAYWELPVEVVPEIAPYATGVAYVRVRNVPEGATLTVEARSDDAEATWGVLVVEGERSDWVLGSSLAWTSMGTGDLVVGVVDLDQDAFANTGDTADLREGQSTLAIVLSSEGSPAADGPAGPEAPDAREETKERARGCGCAVTSRSPLAALVLVAFVALRRRTPCASF